MAGLDRRLLGRDAGDDDLPELQKLRRFFGLPTLKDDYRRMRRPGRRRRRIGPTRCSFARPRRDRGVGGRSLRRPRPDPRRPVCVCPFDSYPDAMPALAAQLPSRPGPLYRRIGEPPARVAELARRREAVG